MNTPSRRQVLRAGSTALAAGAVLPRGLAFHPGGNAQLKVGLVGCGGRGTGAAFNALAADPEVKLWALADAFGDQIDNALASLSAKPELSGRIEVPPERRFTGLDGYLGVIAQCDVVLLATAPYFRPQHVAAAVAAKKHLFVEKPVATDAPGVRSVMESARLAKQQGTSLVAGFCYRYERAKREVVQRIHEGAIGKVLTAQTTYNTSGLWHRGRATDWSERDYQLRNWLYFTWLSGDHIVEQHIHSLDKVAWVLGNRYPVKATSSGGRSQRTESKYGNIYDHFNTVYEWEDGVKCFSSCRQWNGASTDVSDHIVGEAGVAHLMSATIDGPKAWRHRSEEPDDMYQNEMDELFASIRTAQPIHDGEHMCRSTLMAIMGRMAAYTGQTVTWEQALSSQEDLTPRGLAEGSPEVAPVAVPGVTKFT
jgi:predicted dehydrogenase